MMIKDLREKKNQTNKNTLKKQQQTNRRWPIYKSEHELKMPRFKWCYFRGQPNLSFYRCSKFYPMWCVFMYRCKI